MPTSAQVLAALQDEQRRRAAMAVPGWNGSPLVSPQTGPTPGVPVGGVPYTLPPISFPQVALPSVSLPSMPSVPAPNPNVAMMNAPFPANVIGQAGRAGGLLSGAAAPEAKAATAAGQPWDFAAANTSVGNILRAETGGSANPATARNPRSSAAGPGQFLSSTWMDKDLRKRAGYANVDDATWKKLHGTEAGATASVAMTAAYAQRNAEQWEKAMGTAPSPGQLYGMHFLDAGPFVLLTQMAATQPDKDAAAIFGDAAKANPEIFYTGTGKQRRARTTAEVYGELMRRGGDTDPFTMPDLQGLDPGLAGTLPMPGKPRTVDLPNAPEMPTSPARPQQEELPVQQWMEQLKAFAPKSFDEKAANEGRIGAVLTGLAQGAASVDARRGVGAVLAAMGAGASQVQTLWAQGVKAEKKQTDEAMRLFELSLARQGIDWAGQNRDVRQRNRETQWQDQRDALMTGYQNKANQWETDVREALTNNGILRDYDRDVFGAKTNRARTALSITEFNAQLTNQQLTGQKDLDLKRFLYEDEKSMRMVSDGVARQVLGIAQQVGIDPKMAYQAKDPVQINALQGFAYMAANNKPAAINALGAEIVYSGRFDLIPDKKKASELEMMVKQGHPEVAAAHVGRLLNEDEAKTPGSALAWAQSLAGYGLPTATAFLRLAQPKVPTANAGAK